MTLKKIKITQDDEKPITVEVLAEEIVKISKAMKSINDSRLTRHAILALIKAKTGMAMGDIDVVLSNLEDLEKTWLKPKRSA